MYKTTDKYDGVTADPAHDPAKCPICGGQLEYTAGHDWQECELQPWRCTGCGATGKALDEWADEPSFLRHVEVVPAGA